MICKKCKLKYPDSDEYYYSLVYNIPYISNVGNFDRSRNC